MKNLTLLLQCQCFEAQQTMALRSSLLMRRCFTARIKYHEKCQVQQESPITGLPELCWAFSNDLRYVVLDFPMHGSSGFQMTVERTHAITYASFSFGLASVSHWLYKMMRNYFTNQGRFPFDQIFRFEIPGILCDEWNSIFRFVGLTNPRSSGSKFRTKIRDQTEGSFTFVYLLWGCSTTLKLK